MCEVYIRFPTETIQIPAMSCLDAKISLVPKHQLIVPPTVLAPATHIRTDKATKIHTLSLLTYELFFQNSSKKKIMPRVIPTAGEGERKKNPYQLHLYFIHHTLYDNRKAIN